MPFFLYLSASLCWFFAFYAWRRRHVTAAVPFAAAQLTLDPGDLLFAFTDGVIDARDEQRAFFGEPRLLAGLRPATPAAELIAQLQAALQTHMTDAPQADDITMLALRRK